MRVMWWLLVTAVLGVVSAEVPHELAKERPSCLSSCHHVAMHPEMSCSP